MAEKKKYDPDIVGWITRGGKHIPVRSGWSEGKSLPNGWSKGESIPKSKKSEKTTIDYIDGPQKEKARYYNRDKNGNLVPSDDPSNREVYKKQESKHKSELDPEIKAKIPKRADELIEEAKSHEPQVTEDLKAATEGTGGSIDKGLPYKIKGKDSLQDKLETKMAKKGEDYTPNDVLRYTDLLDEENFTDGFFEFKERMESKGYTMVECANTMGDTGVSYRGVNTIMMTPDGYKFEFQFHTPTSLEIKEINHKMYKLEDGTRIEDLPEAEQIILQDKMIANANKIPTPPGVDRIPNF